MLTTEHTNDHIGDICHNTNKHWRQYTSTNLDGEHSWGWNAETVQVAKSSLWKTGKGAVEVWDRLVSFDSSIYANSQY
jgi:hypothetical protein